MFTLWMTWSSNFTPHSRSPLFLKENESELNQLRIQLHQLEEEHQLILGEKDAVNAENLKFRATVAELEADNVCKGISCP